MSAVAAAIGIGAAATIGSAYMSNQATKKAGTQARDAAANQMAMDLQRNREGTTRLQPYMDIGAKGLGQVADFDLLQGVGPEVSYDTEYTNKLGDYETSPAFEAQNAIAQQELGRASHARKFDTGRNAANAQAELKQKLVSTDYDKYRGDLAQRYKALQGEYSLRRENNQNRYKQLMDQVGIGQWGVGNKQNLDAGLGAAQAQQRQATASANNAIGAGTASMWNDIGSAVSSAAGGMAGGLGKTASAPTAGGTMFDASQGLNGAGQPIQAGPLQSNEGYTWPGASFG